jgi:hypothetical protein
VIWCKRIGTDTNPIFESTKMKYVEKEKIRVKVTPKLFEDAIRDGKQLKDLEIETGWADSTLGRYAQNWGFHFPKCSGLNINDLTGQTFGRLYVIRQLKKGEHDKKTKHAVWLCQCQCGKTKAVHGTSLVRKLTTSCGCYNADRSWSGYNTLSGSYWVSLRKSALRRNLEFNISKEYVWDILEKQNFRCNLSGVPIEFDRKNHKETQTASVDRIDSKIGYFEGNIQILHKNLNRLKHGHLNEYIISWSHIINNYQKLKNKEEMPQVKYKSNLIPDWYWKNIIRGAEIRSMKFEIDIDYAWELFLKQNGVCALSGIPIEFHGKYSNTIQTASLDRIDSSKGYEMHNLQWLTKKLNRLKLNFSQELFLDMCKNISEFDLEKNRGIIQVTN